jgi:hypothetical protein
MINVEENQHTQVNYINTALQYVQKEFQNIIMQAEINP